jgi:Ni2+-binding GTPase involved in maturation of urease and hydrogenase
MDLHPQTNFNVDIFTRGLEKINSQAGIIKVSATDGSGFQELVDWVVGRLP